jgi:hypothetical protein
MEQRSWFVPLTTDSTISSQVIPRYTGDIIGEGFGARGKRLNLVMTLKRKGSNFPSFLQQLLSRMACGDTMPVAWNDICPQIPRSDHPDASESVFFAGRGGVRLLA